MTPSFILSLFKSFRDDSGIVGAAFGPKETNGKSKGNPHAVTFFVAKKFSLRGSRRRLEDGRKLLPRSVEFQGAQVPTDVVEINGSQAGASGTRSPPQTFRAGGKVSNMQLTGTIGCLVTQNGRPGLYALTNQHIALGAGTLMFFPDAGTIGAVVGTTDTNVGLVADENFLRTIDEPLSYVDVDAGLVQIPAQHVERFSPEIPVFGRPGGIFTPDLTSAAAYRDSLIGRDVFAYSWSSLTRRGVISHVYYVYSRNKEHVSSVACFLVKSLDDVAPGLPGDSGKLWMTEENGMNLGIGIHLGLVSDTPTSSRFAMATEMAALARYLNISLWLPLN
jgi:hypothetical protein